MIYQVSNVAVQSDLGHDLQFAFSRSYIQIVVCDKCPDYLETKMNISNKHQASSMAISVDPGRDLQLF